MMVVGTVVPRLFFDSRTLGVAHWWLVLPAGFCVGLSLALPLYLYFREKGPVFGDF